MTEKLGRYDILEEIGQGTFALVYRARDTTLDRPVALKKMKASFFAERAWITRFYQEAKTIARLDHPHIVTIYDVQELADSIFIVMRLVDGPSLDKLLAERGRLSWPETVAMIEAIAAALDYAHSSNILHRDLKPANILLDARRGPMLGDFGLAKLANEASSLGSKEIVGTTQYIAPEVWEGQGSSRQSDIYALGCILYEMLAGEHLFQGESPPSVMMAHFGPVDLPQQWPAGVPAGVGDILRKALSKKSTERYATAGALVKALVDISPVDEQQPRYPGWPQQAESNFAQKMADLKEAGATLRLYLFGTPRLEREDEAVNLRGRKIMALAAYLATTGQTHSRDAIAALFWPDHDQSGARANLRRELSRLNKALGAGVLAIDRESVGLSPEATLWLDVAQFQRLLAGCQSDDRPAEAACAECLPPLTQAAALYADDFLAGFTLSDSAAFDDWQFFQRESLRQRLANVLAWLASCHARQHAFEPAIEYVRRWLALDPLHEPAHRTLMQLYAQNDQRAAALRQYEECVRLLDEELGAAPDAETTALYDQIYQRSFELPGQKQVPSPETATDKQPALLSLPPHNLPTLLTPLIGRERELAELVDLLQAPDLRLITLLGSGGIGKTHLAIEAALRQLHHFQHGVYFVPLAPLETAGNIVPAIAAALSFSFYEGGSPKAQLLSFLSGKTMLLLLDNFEHLTEGMPLVVELLEAAPQLKILATSQVKLRMHGEQLLQLSGMSLPPDLTARSAGVTDYGAIDLFLRSARRTLPDFEPSQADLAAVLDICRLVQGIPLGILLAAAWVELLSPPEIAAEIRRSFDFLESDVANLPLRQRSLRAVFDSAWQLLAEPEQAVFTQLSLFRGGFSRQAAQSITGASLRNLMRLTGASLLQRTPTGRYQVHELLRQYAAEKLARQPASGQELRRRHSRYYAEALAQRQAGLRGGSQQTSLAEIESDIENVRLAWRWAVANRDLASLAQAVESLFHFYDMRSLFQEGAEMFQRAATMLETDSAGAEADSMVSEEQSGSSEETERLRQLLSGKILARLGWFTFQLGQQQQAESMLRRSLEILEPLAEFGRPATIFSLNYLGAVQRHLGQYKQAQQQLEKSVAICQAVDDQFGMSIALNVLGQVAYAQGEYEQARQVCRRSLRLARTLDHQWGIAFSLTFLGQVAEALAEYDDAKRFFQESLEIRRELNDPRGIAICFNHLGDIAQAQAAYDEAKAHHADSLKIFTDIGNQWGRTKALVKLGEVACALDEHQTALATFTEALENALAIRARPLILDALVGMATVLLETDRAEPALETLAVVINHPHSSRKNQDRAAQLLAQLAQANLPPEAVAAAQQQSQMQDLNAFVAHVLDSI